MVIFGDVFQRRSSTTVWIFVSIVGGRTRIGFLPAGWRDLCVNINNISKWKALTKEPRPGAKGALGLNKPPPPKAKKSYRNRKTPTKW